jgi:hypothetical protein
MDHSKTWLRQWDLWVIGCGYESRGKPPVPHFPPVSYRLPIVNVPIPIFSHFPDFLFLFPYRAHSVIVAHNHPSGDPSPSQRDVEMTQLLMSAGKVWASNSPITSLWDRRALSPFTKRGCSLVCTTRALVNYLPLPNRSFV